MHRFERLAAALAVLGTVCAAALPAGAAEAQRASPPQHGATASRPQHPTAIRAETRRGAARAAPSRRQAPSSLDENVCVPGFNVLMFYRPDADTTNIAQRVTAGMPGLRTSIRPAAGQACMTPAGAKWT
ncbi:hypothetical protein [Roseomonas indoligenes]|uniref:Uncharacterized protein n=1 Tax=Roseomonas indoligenes TaxID=2820811 RepID=A0A940N1T3_9PROT|nr:hypothetical protein [Pararoseomonas indoligenes]MBP0495165.1 hypothetical protein [Pararoseomonas indoligenes]